jgi:copper homeostasis protein
LKPGILEICCTGIESALLAEASGADRLEICSVLTAGGITPSPGFLALAIERLKIPVFPLIRPREGGFVYSSVEKDWILNDIEWAKNIGANGIVGGALDAKGEVDLPFLHEMMAASYPLPFTFHRAFDLTRNLGESLEILKKAGCARVLTSGGLADLAGSVDTIRMMHRQSEEGIIVMPGGGLTFEMARVLKSEGIGEFHFSAKTTVKSGEENTMFSSDYITIDGDLVKKMKAAIVE